MALHNIYADHGYPADEATVLALRSDIARIIRKATDGLRQKDAARRLRIAQGDLSKIRNGCIDALSVERLVRLCVRLGIDCAAQWGSSPHRAVAVSGDSRALAQIASDTVVAEVPVTGETYGEEHARVTWTPTAQ